MAGWIWRYDAGGQFCGQFFGSFVISLAGISITVLTLVLALPKEHRHTGHFRLLYTTLVVATLACIQGAHLMGDAASWESRFSGAAPYEGSIQAFMTAAPTGYVATVLVMFALVLLPKVYDPTFPRIIRYILLATLAAEVVGSWLSMIPQVWLGAGVSHNKPAVIVAVIGVIGLGVYEARAHGSDFADYLPLIICWVIVCLCGAVYGIVCPKFAEGHWWLITWLYALGATWPSSALIGCACRLTAHPENMPQKSETDERVPSLTWE